MTAAGSIVIVGASLAGLRAAEALRDNGFDGRLTIIGDEPHAPYDRPPLSKQVLQGWVAPTGTTLPRLRSVAAEWRLGTAAVRLDRHRREVHTDDGHRVAFDHLVVATGTRARRWTIEAERGLRGVHTLRTPEDAAGLLADLNAGPGRVLIVGAGFTGSEIASACRDRGLPVTVVERLAGPMMASFGSPLADFCAQRQRDADVDLRCGVGVTALLDDGVGRVAGATLSNGETIAADVVVLCLGADRNVEWLDGAGLDAGPAGLTCDASGNALDDQGRPDPAIFACGDVTRFRHPLAGGRLIALEHWATAVDQARIVAANLLAPGSASNDDAVPRFWSMQFGMSFKVSGLPFCADRMMVVQGSIASGRFVAVYGRGSRMVGVVAANQARWLSFYENLVMAGDAYPPRYRVVDAAKDPIDLPVLFGVPDLATAALMGCP